MPTVGLECPTCGHRAKRELVEEVACRGIHETACEPATCPTCRIPMVRLDGREVADPGSTTSWTGGPRSDHRRRR